jgi:hypothetical protein
MHGAIARQVQQVESAHHAFIADCEEEERGENSKCGLHRSLAILAGLTTKKESTVHFPLRSKTTVTIVSKVIKKSLRLVRVRK